MLEINNLNISVGDKTLIEVNANVKNGEILSIMGPSGSGKSTLLSWIIGQLSNDFTATGSLVLNGKDITHLSTEKRSIGLMFQDPVLFPHLSVFDNIGYGIKGSKKQKRDRIHALLSNVNLEGFADRMPNTLSGGQQSRIALLRLIASEPDAVLLDEPFSNLDARNKHHTRDFVFEHLTHAKIPIILVTHDQEDVKAVDGNLITFE